MPTRVSDYARVITEKKIRYIPPCIIIEIVTSVYGYLTRIPLTRRSLDDERSRIIEVLEILYNDLVCTLDVYDSGRARFFSGDWKTNRQAAQRVFAAFMGRLEKLHYYLWGTQQAQLKEFMTRLEGAWTTLYTLLDERCEQNEDGDGTRYFHSSDIVAWQKTMANIIADLYEKSDGDDEEHLMLLCCGRVKARLVKQIEQMQIKREGISVFDGDCLLCVSQRDINASCPLCMRFSDDMQCSLKPARHDTATSLPIHPAYRAAILGDGSESIQQTNIFPD